MNIDIIIYLVVTFNVVILIEDVFGDINSSLFFFNFMESVKDFCIKKIILVFLGGIVYGEFEYLFIDEKYLLRLFFLYGIIKVLLENYLYFYKRKYGIDYVVCRYFNLYGKY